MAARGEFSSKIAFILAASGSAIGLGNIWGFPIQVAENGGGAFVFTYMILTFLLAYPVLMTELLIGRHGRKDTVSSMLAISSTKSKGLAYFTGAWGMLTASLILSFYSIVAGWMIAFLLGAIFELAGFVEVKIWLTTFSTERNLLFTALFFILTISIIAKGVTSGIERWSTRLMPLLLMLIIVLIIYISMQQGAMEGWRVYLQPDFSRVLDPDLVISALGQAFFSLSIGVGTMMVYGSYVSKQENMAKLGASVAAIDIGIAVLAGLLVIPAMYVALHNGVEIFNSDGQLIDSDGLIFTVLPSLFETMGISGLIVAILFFALMSIAAITSSISMLEVPVAYVIERHEQTRTRSAWFVGGFIFLISLLIVFNFSTLFGFVIDFTTRYSQPLIGLLFCIFAGWVWQRTEVLKEISQGFPDAENSLFWKVWPNYVRYVCPLVVLAVFIHSVFGS